MAELVSDLIEQVREEAGFDVTVAAALRTMTQRHRKMVVRARLLRDAVELGPTILGQAAYTLPGEIVELEQLKVDGVLWRRAGARTLSELQGEIRRLVGSGGVYAQWPTAAGVEQVTLYPAPERAGLSLAGLAIVRPDDLTLAGSPIVPAEYYEALVEGTVAALLARVDERLGDADRYEARFNAATEELRRMVLGRLRSGPGQIKVVGYHL